MGCNCTKSASRFLTPVQQARPTTQAQTTDVKKSCPKCYTYKVKKGSGVVRCPICSTVFAT